MLVDGLKTSYSHSSRGPLERKKTMSTIVAVRKGKKAVMASDSLFSQGDIKVSSNVRATSQKIFQVKDALIGFTGWTAMTQIFEDVAEKHPSKISFRSRKHIFKTFLFLHAKLKEDYFIETKERDNQPVESSQWDCVILTPTGIFSVRVIGKWSSIGTIGLKAPEQAWRLERYTRPTRRTTMQRRSPYLQ